MSRKKTFYLSITALCVLVLFFTSCKDDSVTPKTTDKFDTARFNWKVDTLWVSDIIDMWASDSSNVYFVTYFGNNMLHLKNGVLQTYQFDNFYPRFIRGLSNNEIYIGGSIYRDGIDVPHLKKFDGIAFTDIPIYISGAVHAIYRGAIKNSNDMWFGTTNFVLRYDGISFSAFPKDTSKAIVKIYFNEMDIPSMILAHTNFPTDTLWYNYLYQFTNNSWNLVFDNTQGYTNLINLSEIKGKTCGKSDNCVYDFTGSGFTKLYCGIYSLEWFFTGTSFNEIMSSTLTPDVVDFITNWNGNKWSKEIEINMNVYFPLAQCVNTDLYYLEYHQDGTFANMIYRGMRKK